MSQGLVLLFDASLLLTLHILLVTQFLLQSLQICFLQ
jgi:hypothetical protein